MTTPSKSLTVERVFDAPIQDVWRAWTDPEQYKKWYHPAPGMELSIHAFDVRVGGRIHFDMPMQGGRRGHGTDGIFHQVEANKRLVFGARDRSSLNDVTFIPEGKRRRVKIVWTSDDQMLQSPEFQQGAKTAWSASAQKLEGLLRREAAHAGAA